MRWIDRVCGKKGDHSSGKRAKVASRSICLCSLTKSTDAANQFSSLFARFIIISPPPFFLGRPDSSSLPSAHLVAAIETPCIFDMVGILYTVYCSLYSVSKLYTSVHRGWWANTHTKKGRERWYDTEWAGAGCCWMGCWEMGRLDNDPSTSPWSVSFSTSVSVRSSSCTLFFILMVVDAVVWRVSGKKLSRTANPASATKILHFQIFLFK